MSSIYDLLPKGWKVFPCHSVIDGRCTCGNADCASPGKHPRTGRGVKDASNDPAVVANWARSYPRANWALACGSESGVIVIDVDKKSGGYDSLAQLDLPETLTSLTGGGGRHLFFRHVEGIGNRTNWKQGIDVRSDGGYVILPGGRHASGAAYSWHNIEDVETAELTPLPAETAADIASGARSSSAEDIDLSDVAGIFDGIAEGQRDDTLYRWACRLRRQHETDADGGRAAATLLVLAAAQTANFPTEEALKCVDSAFKQDHRDLWAMPEAAIEVQDVMERRVQERMLQMKVEREARRRFDSTEAPAGVGEWDGLLSDLDFPEEDEFLVEDLIPYDGHVLFSAEKKAGKTTGALNLVRSMLTGEPFLGVKKTKKIEGRVGFMNFEVSGRQFKRWAAEHGIDLSRLYAVNRRGLANPLAFEESRSELAAEMKRQSVEVLIIDPFLKAFTGKDDNSSSEVNEWLTTVEAFAVEAGVRNVVLIAHAGKTGETARGSSALEGWPDSIIRLLVNEKTRERHIKAFGRDVYMEKTRLAFDEETRTLTAVEGRAAASGTWTVGAEEVAFAQRWDVLTKFGQPPFQLTKSKLAAKLPGNTQNNLRAAESIINELQQQGLLTVVSSNGRGTTYSLAALPAELHRQASYDAC